MIIKYFLNKFKKLKNILSDYLKIIFYSLRTFKFQDKTYNYFCHVYNKTWRNERIVEIPIIWDIVKKYNNKAILEVGNVLSNYYSFKHDILDKYEKGEGVINKDVVNFSTLKRYDLIISISTLEHVGWDEKPNKSEKILRTLINLKKHLVPGGKMVITLPVGYNKEMDKLLKSRKMSFDESYYLKRFSKDNKWMETTWEDVENIKYGRPFPFTNGLIIGIFCKGKK